MAYDVVHADLELDRGQIVEFWKRHLQVPNPDHWYEWAYVRNPCTTGLSWLLRADGVTVGTSGVIPRRFKVGSRIVVAARAGGLGVEQAHRFLGPALMLQKAMLAETRQGRLDMIYSSLPPHLLGLMDRLAYDHIGPLTRYVRVLRMGPYVRRALGSGAGGRAAAAVLDAVAAGATRVAWRPGIVDEVTSFDGRFDDLWQRAIPEFGVTSERTSRFLTWRFLGTPVGHAYAILTVSAPADGRLLGYAVLFTREDTAYLVDVFAEDAGPAMESVLAACVRWALDASASSLVVKCLKQDPLDRTLRRCGFQPRDDGPPMMVIASPGWNTGGEGHKPLAWHFLSADDFWE